MTMCVKMEETRRTVPIFYSQDNSKMEAIHDQFTSLVENAVLLDLPQTDSSSIVSSILEGIIKCIV